jgi:predicted ester cyclase
MEGDAPARRGWSAFMDKMPASRGEHKDEPALVFSAADKLSPQRELVRIFYKEMWDRADISLIPKIFHKDFTFRGSLGPTLRGHKEFEAYVQFVTGVLGDYTSDILVLVEEETRVTGKLRFHGIHRGELLGVPPTGRHVWWFGAPIFTFEDGKVRDLRVLGDVHGLEKRLRGA